MPLYIDDAMPRRTGAAFSEYPAPFGDVVAAQVEDAWHWSPSPSIMRYNAMEQAEGWRTRAVGKAMVRERVPVPRISAEAARDRIKAEGLDLTVPDTGIAAPALDLLIEMKRAEVRRQLVLGRAQGGAGEGAARFGAALGISLLDPLNIATAFTPVIGEMRASALLARAGGSALGRAGMRAGIGVTEGTAGAALVEPFIYSQAQREQADYTMADSLYNIAFGGLIGGGLHVVGGAVADRFRRTPGAAPKVDAPGGAGAAPDAPRGIDAAYAHELAQREALAQVHPKGLADARLQDPAYRSGLESMARNAGWAEEGGRMLRDPLTGEVMGRSEWIPIDPWYGEMQADASIRIDGGREGVEAAVRKALAGEQMTAQERRAVDFMLDKLAAADSAKAPIADAREIAWGLEEPSGGYSEADLAAIERAREFDPERMESLPDQADEETVRSMVRSILAEEIGDRLGGVSHLRGIIEQLARVYMDHGPELGRVQLDEMAQYARSDSGFSDEVATPGFVDELHDMLTREAARVTGAAGTARAAVAAADPVVRADTLRAAVVQAVEGRQVEVDALLRQQDAEAQVSAAARSAGPDAVLSVEPDAPARTESQTKEAGVMQGVESAQAELERAMQSVGEEGLSHPEIKAAAEGVKRAGEYRKALEAAAACGVG